MTPDLTGNLFETGGEKHTASGRIIRVAFDSAADALFDYLVPDHIPPVRPGQRVKVPFGKKNKTEVAFCVVSDVPEQDSYARKHPLKNVISPVDEQPLLDEHLLELAKWISEYYVCPLGQVLSAMVPAGVKRAAGAKTEKCVHLSVSDTDIPRIKQELKGRKQKRLLEILHREKAFDPGSALKVSALLQKAECTIAPLKKLIEKKLVKVFSKTVLKALPAVPKDLAVKAEPVTLNEDQEKALRHFRERIESGNFGVTLLFGVTDSGKTELYIRAVQQTLTKKKSAVILLPEIALTAQTVQRFNSRFENIAVMHSGLTASQRHHQWRKIKQGEAHVVIGARSAVFAPVKNLGLIVVDEEHEQSYKQDTVPRYHARDVAVKRAQLADAHCILGTATPSLETLHNCRTRGHFHLVKLPKRVMNLPLPQMKLIDMRRNVTKGRFNLISPPLEHHLRQTLEKKEQAIMLLNRRGYSSLVFCPACKHILRCRNCDVTLTFHKLLGPDSRSRDSDRPLTVTGRHFPSGYAVCHYCLAKTLVPENCPLCGKKMTMLGTGSQRLEEELKTKFPHAKLARLDSDAVSAKDYYRILQQFNLGRIDILAGTQILAKGLHFPNVTLVGIISADTCLYLPDFRANERTFQLISHVSGRAGRSVKKGTVYVQTFVPDQPAIRYALKNDFDAFIREELEHRKNCRLPPFWRLAVILMQHRNFETLETAADKMKQRIDRIIENQSLTALARDPVPAVISRIQRLHRMQIVVQAPAPEIIRRLFAVLRREKPLKPAVKYLIDIDPVNLL